MTAVAIVTVLAPPFLLLLADSSSVSCEGLLQTLGFRRHGLMFALVYPAVMVSCLYLGPIVQRATSSGEAGIISSLREERTDIFLRNYVIAPVAEELVFRSCMIPLLLPHLGQGWTVLLCPLFFGVAHFHHMFEHLIAGTLSVPQALFNVFVQTAYTSLFGMFSAHLFLRTGHVTSAIVAHVMCNVLGLPELMEIPQHRYRLLIGALYLIGFGVFVLNIYKYYCD